MRVLLVREWSQHVPENCYAVFLPPSDDLRGSFSRRFTWDHLGASQYVKGSHFKTWQGAMAAAKRYAREVASALNAEIVIQLKK